MRKRTIWPEMRDGCSKVPYTLFTLFPSISQIISLILLEFFWFQKLEEQVDKGKALNIGLSNFNIRQIKNVLKSARIHPACLQVEIQPYLQQKELCDFCNKNNIVVTGYANLGRPGLNVYYERNGLP